MTDTATTAQYTTTAKILHWLVAGMIVLQFVLANLAKDSESPVRELALLANHKSVGITILVLAVARILWRIGHRPPPLPAAMPDWQKLASHISHWSLYALLFLLPLTGWLMSSASAYSVSWFNLFQLPDFVAPNPELKERFEDVHELLGYALIVVASLHILAALKHAIIDKDDVLSRMTSVATLVMFALVVGLGIWSLASPGNRTAGSQPVAASSATAAADDSDGVRSDLPLWSIDYDKSFIHFTGDQAGASFDGRWEEWSAELQFDAEALDSSRFDVTIRTAAVATDDDDRDSTLADPEWFDPDNYPEASYRATRFTANDDGSFTAHGRLTIKDIPAPVDLVFTVTVDDNRRILEGRAELLRLDLGVGTGEWEDTDWVSNEVTVNVRVEASVD